MKKQLLTKVVLGLSLLCGFTAQASLITNGDFESGVDGWTSFTTENGVTQYVSDKYWSNWEDGSGTFSFDTNGDGVESNALLTVPYRNENTELHDGSYEGGGVFQTFQSTGGAANITADIAFYDFQKYVVPGGMFTLFLNGSELFHYDFERTTLGDHIQRLAINEDVELLNGENELRFEFVTSFRLTEWEAYFIDNVAVVQDVQDVQDVSEPSAFALIGLSLLGLTLRRRKAK